MRPFTTYKAFGGMLTLALPAIIPLYIRCLREQARIPIANIALLALIGILGFAIFITADKKIKDAKLHVNTITTNRSAVDWKGISIALIIGMSIVAIEVFVNYFK
jgi:hypothetical protein